ncbi:MAG: DUF2946 family protein [Rhodocyclales bacterium]|nr:DUF2946 family protein [Rhodocyclales bacterium]
MHAMRRSAPIQRLTAWIAALAMVAAALMPAVTQAATAAAGGQAWLEVCTVFGVERIAVDSTPDSQPVGGKARGMACPWCHLPVGLPDAPAAAAPHSMDYGDRRIVTAREQQVPRSLAGATSSRPRAPPLNL